MFRRKRVVHPNQQTDRWRPARTALSFGVQLHGTQERRKSVKSRNKKLQHKELKPQANGMPVQRDAGPMVSKKTVIFSTCHVILMRIIDSPPPTPTISPSKPVQQPSGKGKADTPQPGKGSATRKTGGRPGGRGKRVGRNQYTRDLYDPADGILRDGSRDANGHSPHGINGDTGRSSKARTHSARTSLNEMKKRVAAILEFVSQMQSQQSNSSSNKQTSSNSNGSTSRSSNGGKGNSTPNGMQLGGTPTSKLVEAVTAGLQDSGDGKVKMLEEGEFSKMGSVQMMETLMKELVGWQTVYGVYSR